MFLTKKPIDFKSGKQLPCGCQGIISLISFFISEEINCEKAGSIQFSRQMCGAASNCSADEVRQRTPSCIVSGLI